ncbi:hypothetical protein KIN20_017954 [Parelaphostrongylus tenuis]|uniref:Uncharacterized protein n=1 Tax=Parelaphostrongylus tenuis TaxID=148309 RepID=A0AAD5QP22_PARTN|nr:hypothetical protein KIN20_017954 [Parelaphostrongylus tenuis]
MQSLLKDRYAEFVQENEFRWLELHTKLTELWNHCHVADGERLISSCCDPDKHNERDSLSKVVPSQGCVRRLDQVEGDTERTLNEVTLPKLVKKLITAHEQYRKSHPDDDIKVHGFTPPDYVNYVLDEYNASKEVERKNRQMQRMASTSSLRTLKSCQAALPPKSVSSLKLGSVRKDGPKHSSPKQSTPKVRVSSGRMCGRRASFGRKHVLGSWTKPPRGPTTPLLPINFLTEAI